MPTPLDALQQALPHAADLSDELRGELIQQIAIQEDARACLGESLAAVARVDGVDWSEDQDPGDGLGTDPDANAEYQERVRGLDASLGAERVNRALIRAGFAVGIALNASGDALDYGQAPPASYRPALVDPDVEHTPAEVLSREEALERSDALDYDVVMRLGEALETPGAFLGYAKRVVAWLNARGHVLNDADAWEEDADAAESAEVDAQAERLRDIALGGDDAAKALRKATTKRVDFEARTRMSVEALYDAGKAFDADMSIVDAA